MVIYIKTGCQFCARALAALDAYGVAYTTKNVSDPEVVKELIALGGKKQEPFLVDGEHMIYESQAIVKYVEEKYGTSIGIQKNKPTVHFVGGGEVCKVN